MKKMFITTVIGSVTSDAVKKLADITRDADGEWLISKVIRIDNLFAAMMKIAIEEDQADILKSRFVQGFPELQFSFGGLDIIRRVPTRTLQVNVDCSDRPGLTREIVDMLSNANLDVEHMEFNRFHVSTIGQTVFSSKLALAVPDEVSNARVVELLEGISADARINVI